MTSAACSVQPHRASAGRAPVRAGSSVWSEDRTLTIHGWSEVCRVERAGRQREYRTHLVRRTYREDEKVEHQTWPTSPVASCRDRGDPGYPARAAALPAGQALQMTRSAPRGHVAAVWAQARALGLPAQARQGCSGAMHEQRGRPASASRVGTTGRLACAAATPRAGAYLCPTAGC